MIELVCVLKRGKENTGEVGSISNEKLLVKPAEVCFHEPSLGVVGMDIQPRVIIVASVHVNVHNIRPVLKSGTAVQKEK